MLSKRAVAWTKAQYAHGPLNPYHPTANPDGKVSFANAENWLMHEDLTQFINARSQFTEFCCSYGEGFTGTVRLRTAMAKHVNTHFKPAREIDAEQITFSAGVTELNEVCAMLTCNPNAGESVMLGKPVYGAFAKDLTMRTGVELEYVDVGDTDQFSPDCVAAYEAGFEAAKARGVDIKAIMLCNPHNPLGECYPRETLVGLMHLCAAKGMHLISDEIYALSAYNQDKPSSVQFTSVLSIDPTGIIDPAQVHVLYGMSKDFGAAGMRLGCVITQNIEFTKAVRAICRFSTPSQYSMDLAAKLLEDQDYLSGFLEKSQRRLTESRLLVEELLTKAGISFHQKGNAGFFMWLDLTAFLPLEEADGDGWAAERLLSQRFYDDGVIMAAGEAYHAPSPGKFRVVFCLEEDTIREGIRRISAVLGH